MQKCGFQLVIRYGSLNGKTLLDPPWSEDGSPLQKYLSFGCIVPHEAHDKFVSELTLFLEKWYSHLISYVLSDSEC